MSLRHSHALLSLLIAAVIPQLCAQPKSEPDVVIFTNGDKLVGHFERSSGDSLTFKSDMIGEITVPWSKVKELHTSEKFAVIRKGVTLHKHDSPASIPQGVLAMEDQKIELTEAPAQAPQSIPVGDTAVIVDQPAFTNAVTHEPGFFEDWKGTITAGASLVRATQDSDTFTGAVSLVRAEPAENWLDPRDRTIFNFSDSYGQVNQTGTPTVKTSIFHADAERDQYFSGRLYAFGEAAFDHNFSQGLNLEQTYSGGVGWTAIKDANQVLDLKASVSYIEQNFKSVANQSLIGSVFGQHYNRKWKHGLVLDQHVTVTPAWNNTSAYSAAFGALLTMPVYKRLSASTGVIDTFLNDPPPAFKKNSFQFTAGLTYSLK